MAYLLDSNTFIEAKNGYYHFDVCPGFWDWIISKHQNGVVYSIEKVRDELEERVDELSTWCVSSASQMFLKPDRETVENLKAVVDWVMKQQNFKEDNRAAFFAKADPFLIAYAKAHDHTIVTLETRVPDNSRKVKVPNVCEAVGVRWMHSFELLRAEKARFVLEG